MSKQPTSGTRVCSDCPIPPAPGEPQPTTRCAECPYHGYVRVREQREDGMMEIRFEPDPKVVVRSIGSETTGDGGRCHER